MSDTKTVFIVGASGFLGNHLARRLQQDFKVFASFFRHPLNIPGVTCVPMEVGDRNQSKRMIYNARPDVLLYCAGSNSLELAEKKPQLCDRTHSMGVAAIATITDILQPKFVYISNSYVFDGFRGNYHEADTVLPGTQLGQSKNGGENIVRARCLNYLIVRSAPLLGRGHGSNLSLSDEWRIQLQAGNRVEIPFEQIHSFSHVNLFCEFMAQVLQSNMKNKTLHFGGVTKLGMLEMAQSFADHFGYDRHHIQLRKSAPQAKNPKIETQFKFDFSLNVSMAVQQFNLKPASAAQVIEILKEEHQSSSPFS